jgi:heme-degrading monooxygenase HmoA
LAASPEARCHNAAATILSNDWTTHEDQMILELVDIRIQPGKQQEFDAAIVRGLTEVISKAKGFCAYRVNKGIESPERYVLMIYWETLENHTVDFRESPAFLAWRGIVGPFFAAPPQVEHFTLVGQTPA